MTSIFPWQQALLGYICPASSNLVCNEGQRVAPYSSRQSLALFMEDSTNYCCQNNVTTFIQVPRFVVNMFYCSRVAFIVFNHADIKGVRQRLTSTASLDDEYCEATTPVVNTLRPRQNGRHFTDDTFKRIFLNENVRISIKISLKFVPKAPINNIPALV